MWNKRAQQAADEQAARARREREQVRHEQERRDEILRSNVGLRTTSDRHQLVEGRGEIVLAVVGTAFTRPVTATLQMFVRGNADSFVGNILLAEPDAANRSVFLRNLPSGLPAGRVTPVPLPLLRGGLSGLTVSQAKQIRHLWQDDLETAIASWLRDMRQQPVPNYLLLYISPGGAGVQGELIVERFKREYPQAAVYAILALDAASDRRLRNVQELLDLYGTHPLVAGLLLLDNQRQSRRHDQALALLMPGMIVGPWIDAQPHASLNALADTFRHHRFATLRTWVGYLGVHHAPAFQSLPEFYYSDMRVAQLQAMRGIEAILGDGLDVQSVPLAVAHHPRYAYVVACIRPVPEYAELAERAHNSDVPGVTNDTIVQFASIGYPLSPAAQEAPMVAIGLVPLLADLEAIKDYVRATASPAEHQLPGLLADSIHIEEQPGTPSPQQPRISVAAQNGQKE